MKNIIFSDANVTKVIIHPGHTKVAKIIKDVPVRVLNSVTSPVVVCTQCYDNLF